MHFTVHELRALFELSLFSFLVNIPLGAWRVSVKKFSWQWFVAVHLCVPIIFVLRRSAGLSYQVIPILILFSLSGHFIGGKSGIRLFKRLKQGITAIISNLTAS